MTYRYRAVQVKQTSQPKALVLFAPPAVDIDLWAGVPRKKRLEEGDETVGFQREENPARVESLTDFYSNDQNIIQNALLGATRESELGSAKFEPDIAQDDLPTQSGWLVIELPDYQSISLTVLFGYLRHHLEARVPDLVGEKIEDSSRFRELQQLIAANITPSTDPGEEDNESESDASQLEDEGSADSSIALFEESHILDFWREIAARHEILKSLGTSAPNDELLGYSRDVLLSYLLPVVLVDGQHRLRGAIEAARAKLNTPELQMEARKRVNDGEESDYIDRTLIARECRLLPMSLLMSSDPAEQVFQFVVVNQKATPIGRALLGTIVSTTLSNHEVEQVAARLRDAGIPLEESRAVTYLARNPESPFFELVERGLTGDSSQLLQWTALSSLIRVFRDLDGGRLYGQKNDYADIWCDRHLLESGIVSDFSASGFNTQYEYWRSLEGPWRYVFMKFFSAVRDKLGNIENPDRYNYWGRPRHSNLFNKVSLTILAADFFKFLTEQRAVIDAVDDIPTFVDDWLQDVNLGYFDKDWEISGVKRDSTGIRNQWAYLWSEYRIAGGNLPPKTSFRKVKPV